MAFSDKLRQAVLGTACFVFVILAIVPLAVGQPMTANDKLVAAAGKGDAAVVQAALREGAAIDARDRNGRTALLIATHANKVEVARVLIAAGADVNARSARGAAARTHKRAQLLRVSRLAVHLNAAPGRSAGPAQLR